MTLPDNSTFALTDEMTITRLLNGMWQVSGAHGQIDPQAALDDMLAYHAAGFRTWDLADHYGPAEDFIGKFKARLAQQDDASPQEIQAFTKWVPRPGSMSREKVEAAIDVSRRRMNADTLDMLQFHWWDYNHPAYIDAMQHMQALQSDGKIRYLGLTNFDTSHMRHILDAGVPLVSNQVQFSIIDRRPEQEMIPACEQYGVHLLTYGTLCGGLLTDRYVDAPEPSRHELTTASLRKYKNMIDQWGGWALFQELLQTLRQIADKHAVSIANVATRYILDKPQVAGVIAGVRLGVREHRDENARVFTVTLDDDDHAAIDAFQERSRDLFHIIGDCGDEYRR